MPAIEDFRHLPFDEILTRWGDLEALVSAVKAAKLYGDLRAREADARSKRGELVERRIVSAVLVPLVNLAFTRLVSEAPLALREQIISRVMSGGEDLSVDVEKLIRNEISGILSSCRERLSTELEDME
jgi:hypothetical protein